jgi:ribosomal protein S14
LTSFQYSFFSAHASSVKKTRNAITGKPSDRRCSCAGSAMYSRKLTVSRTKLSYSSGESLPGVTSLNS